MLFDLKLINKSLGKNYHLFKIYFLPLNSVSNLIYKFRLQKLIKHYDSGNEIKKM